MPKTIEQLTIGDLLRLKQATGAGVSFESPLSTGSVIITLQRGENEGRIAIKRDHLGGSAAGLLEMLFENWNNQLEREKETHEGEPFTVTL